jgi:hypothetical protein
VTPLRASVLAALVVAVGLAAPAGAAHGRPARRSNARTGRIAPGLAELVKASKRGDRAALARAADRLGPARLAEALASKESAVGEAALAAVPLARGGVMLVGTVASELWAADPERAAAAAAALGALLDGDLPTELEDWDVPPDLVAQACGTLKAVPVRPGAPIALRLAALDAIAAAAPTCGELGDVAALARDPAPAIRRAAALLASGGQRSSVLREAVADPDPGVSAAATAAACRVEARPSNRGKPEPPTTEAIAAARARAAGPATPADDAVEMLDCLAAAGTAADTALIDQLRRRPPSPLRDRAVELGGTH